MENLQTYIKHPSRIAYGIVRRLSPFIKSDELYLRILYYLRMHKRLDLTAPCSFSEKMQWLKLYNRQTIHTNIVDKVEAKVYISEIVGEEYVIPTIGVWDNPEDIEWDRLPEKFVLKTTHGGGGVGVVICRDKLMINKHKVIKNLKKALNQDVYSELREWPYKNVKKRVMAEPLLEESEKESSDLMDYKFFCFNGKPKFCQVVSGRKCVACSDFFDLNWQHQEFHEPREYPFSKGEIKKPVRFDDMIEIAKKLSNKHPFLRVDFYEVDARPFVGELTFFPTSGFGGFFPEEWDNKFGALIELPSAK